MTSETPPICLTIAGSDSGGGAGVQADLSTFAALSCYGTSAFAALTAQNTQGVDGVLGVEPPFLEAQINSLFNDIPPVAIKTGMLYSDENIKAIVRSLSKFCSRESHPPLVVDPVMVSTSGHTLLADSAISALKEELLPWATIVTPNIPEAEILANLPKDSIKNVNDMKACAKRIAELGAQWIYVKGGHLPSSQSVEDSSSKMVDVLYESSSGQFTTFERPRHNSKNTHGTGCTLSAAMCAYIAQGNSIVDAVRLAGDYVSRAIALAFPLGSGNGPVNHGHTKVQRALPPPMKSSPHPFTDYLIAQTGDLWEKYVNHPFTVQLGLGTLPMAAFIFYIRQDYSFLLHYARTNALAAYKSKSFGDLAANSFIVQTILHEVEMHIKFCKSQGITKEMLEDTKESVTNIAYNRYVLDVANTGDMLDLRVATAPCLLGYGEVGVRLVNKPDGEVDRSDKNPYYSWALNYAKEDFQTAVHLGREQLERMVAEAPMSQKRLDELAHIFRQTTELEIAFWDSALEAAKSL